jgi:hypothetical protein
VTLDGAGNDGQAGEEDLVGPDLDIENVGSTYAGTNVLVGDGGPNVLTSGGFSDNELYGEEGADTLLGGAGQDTADGGPGPDVLRLGPNAGTVTVSTAGAFGLPREVVQCPAGSALGCFGTVTVRTASAVNAGGAREAARRKVTLARSGFGVSPGSSWKLKVKLSRKACECSGSSSRCGRSSRSRSRTESSRARRPCASS